MDLGELLFTVVTLSSQVQIMIRIKPVMLFHCWATVLGLGWAHAPIKANEI